MDYKQKYLKYKNKYLQLKELIAGAKKDSKPSDSERKAERARRDAEVKKNKLAKAAKRGEVVEEVSSPKKTKETELMTYIKANRVDITTLTRDYNRYEYQKNSFDENNNLPLYIYINNTNNIDYSVIGFLLPDDEKLLSKKNLDGDTIMHLVVKKNNIDLLEELWTSGGRNAKLVTNKDGLTLLKLAERLEKSNDKFKKVVDFLKFVYIEDNDEGIDSLLHRRKERETRLETSGFGAIREKSATESIIPKTDLVIVDKKISDKSSGELLAKFNEDYSKFPTYFVFGKKQLEERLDSGIQFESVYVEPSKINNVPNSPNILSIKKIPMTSGLLTTIANDFDGIIAIVAVQSRPMFDL